MFNHTSTNVFLLRSWREDGQLRLRVENPHTNERHTFEHLDDLNAFMVQTLGEGKQTKHGDKTDASDK